MSFETLLENASSVLSLGGPVVAILFALSVLLAALALFKLWQFHVMGIGRHDRAERALNSWLSRGEESVAASLEGDPNPASQILVHAIAGAVHAGGDAQRLAAANEDIERIGSNLVASMRRYLRVFEISAQIAPLLGLFGTVIGMIAAFRSLQEAGAQVDPSDLAGGIWVALLTTAAGLMVAMPASLLLTWFESRIAREQRVMEDMAVSVMTGRIAERKIAGVTASRLAA